MSVLFSDIRGFSTLAERLSARDVAAVVGKHLSAMAEVVLSLGGMIDKFQGDAVMVVFGAPEPTSDHAERALLCAIAMQSRQAELNAEGWGADVPELGVGIGVNTGLVIAGTVGGGGRLEYTVVGDAVNIAQRLQSEAEGGEIVAAASTVAAAPGVPSESIGPRHVKGREEPVEVFRVVIAAEAIGCAACPMAVGRARRVLRDRGDRGWSSSSRTDESLAEQIPYVIAFTMFGVVGALIVSRDRRNTIGTAPAVVVVRDRGVVPVRGDRHLRRGAPQRCLVGRGLWPGERRRVVVRDPAHASSSCRCCSRMGISRRRRWRPLLWLIVGVPVPACGRPRVRTGVVDRLGRRRPSLNPLYIEAVGRSPQPRPGDRDPVPGDLRGVGRLAGPAFPAVDGRGAAADQVGGVRSRGRARRARHFQLRPTKRRF